MSTLRITLQNVPKVLSLLALSMLLAIFNAQVMGEELDNADLLFESVQMAYNPNSPAETIEANDALSEELDDLLPIEEDSAPAQEDFAPAQEDFASVNNEEITEETPAALPAESTNQDVAGEPEALEVGTAETAETKQNNAADVDNNEAAKKQELNMHANAAEAASNTDEDVQQGRETIGKDKTFYVYNQEEDVIEVISKHSKLLRTKSDLIRTAIVDPSICDIVQFTPREISIIGRSVGSTHVTFWFKDQNTPVTFLVNTQVNECSFRTREDMIRRLEQDIAAMFPNSQISLILLSNKVIVRGQARSPEEAMEIMRILREDVNRDFDYSQGKLDLSQETGFENSDLIIVNQIRVPGVQQVALKVKLADLSRTNGSSSGVDFSLSFNGDKILVESLMGAFAGGGGLISYNSANVKIGIDYLIGEGVVRQMSESTLVTMSGTSASLSTGGEIPVPTVTGVDGASAVSTSFRPYGTVINFLPIVMDKDLIRLKISSEFSSLGDDGNEISGVPNLDSRTLNSEIQMREGQTFALGTTVEDNYSAQNRSNIPVFSNILGHKSKSRGEREMVILVSPELVSPMAPDQVPPLPGFDVTEPTNAQFHILGRMEGTPTRDYRSTVWPSLRNRYLSGGSAIISGPYGH